MKRHNKIKQIERRKKHSRSTQYTQATTKKPELTIAYGTTAKYGVPARKQYEEMTREEKKRESLLRASAQFDESLRRERDENLAKVYPRYWDTVNGIVKADKTITLERAKELALFLLEAK